jgi:uncharacterized glyoxalase superfamily protein PhnB
VDAAVRSISASVVDKPVGMLLRPAQERFWGGYSGYFADPDGHAWEVAHNSFWAIGEDGLPELP